MKKKISKIFISTFIVFCVSFMIKSMYAREILDLDELGQQIETINKDAENAYIVGEYVFTSKIPFNLKDVMLGATSIKVSEENETKPENMNIYSLSKNFETNKWEIVNNFIGNGELKFNEPDNPIVIKYVDYQKLKEAYTVTLDLDDEDDSADEYKESIRVDEGKIDASLITGDNAPTRKGYKFKEWVKTGDEDDNQPWNFESDELKENITLKATWYDEVNTDDLIEKAKQTINEGTKANGYFYDVDFDKVTKVVTFNVYDLNQKNSEIKGTGLIADIVNIVKEDNVTSITISNGKEDGTVVFDEDDVTGGTGPTSAAWQQFSNLLKTLTSKEFNEVTLGDLVAIKDKLTLTITLDKDKARSQNNKEAEEYTIEFSYNAPATISKSGKDDDFTDFNYTFQDTYQINGKDGLYNVTGYITEQEGVLGFGDSPSGFYFAYTIKLDDGIDISNAKVKVPTDNSGTKYNEATFDSSKKTVTVLMEVEENEDVKYRDVVIEIDEVPTKIRIDFSELQLKKSSKFIVQSVNDVEDAGTKLGTDFGWKKETGFNTEFKIIGDKVLVTGLLPILDEFTNGKTPFDEDDATGYYLPFVIKTEKGNKNDNSGVTVQFIHEGEDPKTLTAANFDENDVLYILRHLHKDATDKTFKIVVDMDGSGTDYAPYTLTFDWTGLTLQERTTASVNISEESVEVADKTTLLEEYGYQFPNDIKLSSDNAKHNKGNLEYDETTQKLSGTVKEQKLTSGFGQDELDSYFFTYTIKPDKVTDDIKVTVTDFMGSKNYTIGDFTNGTLTILQHIPLNRKTDISQKIEIVVDADGDSNNEYKASEKYTIDYSEVDFVDLHTVTIIDNNGITKETKDIYDGEKLAEPKQPTNRHENDDSEYNKFDHWNLKSTDGYEEDTKYEFTDSKSNDPVTDDLTLYPIWEIDVDQYITDALTHINEKESVKNKFKIGKEVDNTLTLDIIDKKANVEDFSDTAIASTIAHALASGEIESIHIELGKDNKSIEFKPETLKNTLNDDYTYDKIKEEVTKELKEFFTQTVLTESGKTLDDLYKKWIEDEEGLEILISPEKKVAKIKGKNEQAGVTYYVKAKEEVIISFDAGPLNNPSDIINESDSELPTPVINSEEKDYREFVGWFNDDGTEVKSLDDIKVDTTLTAHYKLNVDKFIEDVVKDLDSSNTDYSKDFSGKFDIKQNSNNKNEIEIDLKGANLPLNELAETSIPGTIAYILEKGEINDITLGFDGGTKPFTSSSESESVDELKQKVIDETKSLFNEKLNGKETQVTLDQLEYKDKNFTIEIGDSNKTVELVDSNGEAVSNKTYTFKFDSDFVVVDEDDDLGAQKISEVLDKDYSKIYVDGDVSENDIITITKDVTIEPVKNTSGISLVSETKTTINLTDETKDTVIDVQKGNVTIKDLKITGGKKSEIKVESGANVTVDNIDVSGTITAPEKSENDEMHAHILVNGTLDVKSSITNNNESYKTPTIAVVKYWGYPGVVTGEENEHVNESEHVNKDAKNAKVTVTGMTKNDRYNIIQKEVKEGIDSTVETYYGDFYYVNQNNSNIYYMAINDPEQYSGPFYKIKVYYYDDIIDFGSLGYEPGVTPTLEEKNKIFENLYLNNNVINTKNATPNGLGFKSHDTNMLIAKYKQKPSMTVSLQSTSELSSSGNKISGLIKNETNGKYVIPVTLTSDKFQNGVSTVEVTDPNMIKQIYKYDEENENGIATVSDVKTLKLNLEAIKSSRITSDKGKVYEITVDVDGVGEQYQPEIYTIDYNDVITLEEKINQAAQNTLDVNSFTVKKNNKINNYTEAFTYQYNKNDGLTHLTSDNGDNVEEYTFALKYAGIDDESRTSSVVVSKATAEEEGRENLTKNGEVYKAKDGKIYINDWVYMHPLQVGRAIHEVTMLTDVMKDSKTSINAIDTVEAVEGKEHTYTVKLKGDKYTDWVKNNYLLNSKYTTTEWGETVLVDVELDENDKYIKSIKTRQESSSNTFNVTFENVDNTTIDVPTEFLSKGGKKLTADDIKTFYEAGNAWWDKYVHENAYDQQ